MFIVQRFNSHLKHQSCCPKYSLFSIGNMCVVRVWCTRTSVGAYVKEIVHGDRGRTHPCMLYVHNFLYVRYVHVHIYIVT